VKRIPPRKLDPETALAQARSRQRQERRSVSYLIAIAIIVLGIGLIALFVWPEEPVYVTLTAYDVAVAPDQTAELRARVEPEKPGQNRDLGGLDVRFQIAATQTLQDVATDTGGSARIEWHAPKAVGKTIEFMVRHQHKENPKRAVRNEGRIFIWPADARLLVVDVDHALTAGTDANSPQLRPGAAEALRALGSRHKIVYLSANALEPSIYKNLRAWLRQASANGKPILPEGALLGPSVPLSEADRDLFLMGEIERLKKSFTGPVAAIVGRPVDAKMMQDAGWKAVLLGNGIDAEGAIHVGEWKDVEKVLVK
jgi:hypothetical protein